jgi:hypothetical protein
MILPGEKGRGLYTNDDRKRFHQQLDNMLSEIAAGREHVVNPTEIDIEVRLYYGRWGTIGVTEGRCFSRYTVPKDGHVWDEGNSI